MEYLWIKDVEIPSFPSLDGDTDTDVLIIGGGMAGILCALMLKNEGVDYILVEGCRIGLGITKGTTAVISAQHDVLYSDLIKKFGAFSARHYLEANLQAVEMFRDMSRNISFDFEERPSVMYSVNDRALIEQEIESVRSLGFQAEFISNTALPFKIAGAEVFPGMAQFHPLKFIAGAASGLNIFENTFVRKLEGTVAYTDKGKINARKIIVATHFPFINTHGLYFVKQYQMRSFVVTLEDAPNLGATLIGTASQDMYFRNYKNLLLVGGGDHRTGKKRGGFQMIRNFVRQYYPNAKEKFVWANQDCMSLDGVPYIGRYSPAMPNVFVATGFNEWGITSSMAAALMLTDMMLGRKNRFASIFAPDRCMFRAQMFANLGCTLANFVIPTAKRCTHLGCALKWNKDEQSWDCSCHGSRFDEQGKKIDNPAMKDAKVK